MDVHSNAAVSGGFLEDFLAGENMEGSDDVSLEWLSIFVEDCLSGGFTSQPIPTPPPPTTTTTTTITQPNPTKIPPKAQNLKTTFHKDLSIPSKARTKRRKLTPKAHHTFHVNMNTPSDPPPLLPQAYWLADSELIFPLKEEQENVITPTKAEITEGEGEGEGEEKIGSQPRRCTHCLSQKTPQWRAGPLGPKTLCNACGVRFKSGRLLPEYRPAKSPTFESYKHSNSHKKVMEMRMAIVSPQSN